MTLKLDDIFAGRTRWTIESQNQRFIENTAFRIAKRANRSMPGIRQGSSESPPRLMSGGTTDADDADSRGRSATRQSVDGVGVHRRRLAQSLRQANSRPRPTSGCTQPS